MTDIETSVITTYKPGETSLRKVAELCRTDHHRVKRILDKNNIPIIKAKSKRCEKYQKQIDVKESYEKRLQSINTTNISDIDIRLFKAMSCKNDKLPLEFLLTNFSDYDKIHTLTEIRRSCCDKRNINKESIELQNYYLKYYNDPLFDRLYKQYLDNNKDKWYKPSLDHITPVISGGNNSLDNLEMMSWFENKSKGKKTKDEWIKIKELIFKFKLFDKKVLYFLKILIKLK